MKIYGTFDGNTLRAYKGCDSLTKLGKRYLQRIFKEEGIEWTKKGIMQYLDSWCDWSQDMDEPCDDPECMIDQAVSTVIYSNIHFMEIESRCQITGDEREIVRAEVERILNLPFIKK
tara:strand:+ start:8984 stop:9334 length:351 start_codon:yes stop_codon:yes gene_type:complete